MSKTKVFHRFAFYAAAFVATYIAARQLNICVSGESAFRLFFYISALTGVIQTINLSIYKKSEDIRSNIKLTYLQGLRLRENLRDRREAAFSRSIMGIGFSLVAAASASAMNYFGTASAPLWLFAAASVSALISVIMLCITLFEFKSISDLESELLDHQEQKEAAEQALEDLRKEADEAKLPNPLRLQ